VDHPGAGRREDRDVLRPAVDLVGEDRLLVQQPQGLRPLNLGEAGLDGLLEPAGGLGLLGAVGVEEGAVLPRPLLQGHEELTAVGEELVWAGTEAGAGQPGQGRGCVEPGQRLLRAVEDAGIVVAVLAAQGGDHRRPGRFVGLGDLAEAPLVVVAVVDEARGDPVVDVADPRQPVGGELRRAAEELREPLLLLVHEGREGIDRMVQPRGQGLVLGDPDQRLLVIVAVGLDEGGQQHTVEAGDRLCGGGRAQDPQGGPVGREQPAPRLHSDASSGRGPAPRGRIIDATSLRVNCCSYCIALPDRSG